MADVTRPGAGAPAGPAPPCPDGRFYTVRAGDTMFEIARRFNIQLGTLIAANPQVPDPNMIFPGQVLCIPGAEPQPVECPNGFIHIVRPGESLFSIATRYGTTLEAIRAANPQIVNPDLIFPGQPVCVPVPRPPVTCPQGTLYTVRAGDTMFDIATRFGVTLQALIAANPQVADPSRIFPGQVLCIPTMEAVAPPPPVVISPVVSPIVSPPAPVAPAPMPAPMPSPAPPPCPPCPMPLPCPMPEPCPPCPMPQPCPMRMVCPVAPIPVEPARKKKHHKKRDRCEKHRRHDDDRHRDPCR